LGQAPEQLADRVGRGGDHDGLAAVTALADGRHERDAGQQRNPEALGQAGGTAPAEERVLGAALRAHVSAHVLDHAEHGRAHLGEHRHRPPDVQEGNVLRRGDDHPTRDRYLLHERQLGVARAGRQVDDEEVGGSPVDVAQELPDDAHDERAAPDDGRLLVEEEAHRDEPDAVALERLDPLGRRRVRPLCGPEHDGQARPVDVGVDEPDASEPGERQREVHRHGGLADAALGARHGDDVRDSGERRALGVWVLAAPLGCTRDVELDLPDSRLAAQHAHDVARELPEHLAPRAAAAAYPPPIAEDLARVEERLGQELVSRESRLAAIATHLLGAGGKRIRTTVVLLAFHATGNGAARRDDLIEAAVALELIHSATLLHDDIIDAGDVRRGRPSALRTFGVADTLVAGDFLFSRAFALCARFEPAVIRWAADACVSLTEGEIMQGRFRHNPAVARLFARDGLAGGDVEAGLSRIRESGVLTDVAARARAHVGAALAALGRLPASPYRRALEGLSQSLGDRAA